MSESRIDYTIFRKNIKPIATELRMKIAGTLESVNKHKKIRMKTRPSLLNQ